MSKEHLYKGKIIKNVKYKSENIWFICEENGSSATINGMKLYPKDTLREAKEYLDQVVDKIDQESNSK